MNTILVDGFKNKINNLKDYCSDIRIDYSAAEQFERMISKNSFDIVFVGDFSSGKSSIINAFLNSNMLPTKLTATTARITTVSYGEEPGIILEYDDTENEVPFSDSFIHELTASNPEKIDEINRIKIYYPYDILKNSIKIIDTPGINDTVLQRVEMTYKIIPEADAIVLVLNYPITEHVLEFFKEHILNNKIGNVFVVLNKIDLFDEAEREIILDDIKASISEIVNDEIKLYAVSAADYTEGKLTDDELLVNKSNFQEFQADLTEFIYSSEKYNNNILRYQHHFDIIKNQIIRLINLQIVGLTLPEDVFEERKQNLYKQLSGFQKDAELLINDINDSFDKLLNRLDVSLERLFIEILQGIELSFDQQGSDPNFLLKSAEIGIKNKFEVWKQRNQPVINEYLLTIQKEIQHRLGEVSRKFSTSLEIYSENSAFTNIISNVNEIKVVDEKKAGVFISVASIGSYVAMASAGIAMAPIAMLIMPLGMYYINKMKNEEKRAIKEKVTADLKVKAIAFRQEALKDIVNLRQSILKEVEGGIITYSENIKKQLSSVESERNTLSNRLEDQIQNYRNTLNKITEL